MFVRFESCEKVPWRYGLVYFDYYRHEAVCTIIPLSTVLRILWKMYLWIRQPFRKHEKPSYQELKCMNEVQMKRIVDLELKCSDLTRSLKMIEQELKCPD